MTRPDNWARVDYRSRAVAIICAIATTLVATVTLTAYVPQTRPRDDAGEGYEPPAAAPRALPVRADDDGTSPLDGELPRVPVHARRRRGKCHHHRRRLLHRKSDAAQARGPFERAVLARARRLRGAAQERPRRAGGLVVRLDRGGVLLRPAAAAATAPVG